MSHLPEPMSRRSDGIKIGLALGGGAARGWAHIGVIRALQARGITPSIVAGTSIGALVGACYAADRLDELEAWVGKLEWKEVLAMVDLGFNGGVIRGNKLIDFFQTLLGERPISQLNRPFGAVATDLERGQEIWLREGATVEAVRASIAIPGLFTPSRVGERWLVDGGLVNPVPLSLARAMGADVVIAVDLNSDIMTRRSVSPFSVSDAADSGEDDLLDQVIDRARDLKSRFLGESDEHPALVETITRSLHIMQLKISRSRMAGDPPEVMVTPRLGAIGLMEFHRAAEAIEEGRRAVTRVNEELLAEASAFSNESERAHE